MLFTTILQQRLYNQIQEIIPFLILSLNVYNSFLDGDGEIQGYGIFAVSSKDSVIIQMD